jgi:hypothetical protein
VGDGGAVTVAAGSTSSASGAGGDAFFAELDPSRPMAQERFNTLCSALVPQTRPPAARATALWVAPDAAPREAALYVCIGGWALVEILRRGARSARDATLTV